MTFELKMTDQEAFDGLKASFGKEFVAADVRAFCKINDIAYATVTKKIKGYKDPEPPDCSSSMKEWEESIKKYEKK